MLEYLTKYEGVSAMQMKIFMQLLGINLGLLKLLLVFVKLALVF